jgi:four helix bundle protein
MGVSDYRQLHAWKMARELADRIALIADHGAVRTDRSLASPLMRAGRSVPTNIAEGFGRFSHADFARFLRIARGSTLELREHLHEARIRGLLAKRDADELETLCEKTLGSLVPLIRYLEK